MFRSCHEKLRLSPRISTVWKGKLGGGWPAQFRCARSHQSAPSAGRQTGSRRL